jgi:hypothetical protein
MMIRCRRFTDRPSEFAFNVVSLAAKLTTSEGLISFRDDGSMLVSQDWRADDKRRMHITPDQHLRTVHSESWRYLEYHRDVVFEHWRADCRNKN